MAASSPVSTDRIRDLLRSRDVRFGDYNEGELAREVATCNSTRTGPKAYVAPLEDGTQYGLIAECNIVVLSGLTQTQLDHFFETSMSMIMGFFADLEVTLPGFVDWAGKSAEAQQ